jgi:hypothetical protein
MKQILLRTCAIVIISLASCQDFQNSVNTQTKTQPAAQIKPDLKFVGDSKAGSTVDRFEIIIKGDMSQAAFGLIGNTGPFEDIKGGESFGPPSGHPKWRFYITSNGRECYVHDYYGNWMITLLRVD